MDVPERTTNLSFHAPRMAFPGGNACEDARPEIFDVIERVLRKDEPFGSLIEHGGDGIRQRLRRQEAVGVEGIVTEHHLSLHLDAFECLVGAAACIYLSMISKQSVVSKGWRHGVIGRSITLGLLIQDSSSCF